MTKQKRLLSLLALICLGSPLPGQDTLSAGEGKRYDFLVQEENHIHNVVSLSDFYEKLYRLRKGENIQVRVIHLGDSHIQADFLSSTIRQNFHRDFGNGGRGLIFPGRVARTNEPSNIFTSSGSLWQVKRMVFPDQPLPIGIGGITLRTVQPNATLAIRVLDSPPLNYSFNKITLFFKKDVSSFNVVIKDSVNEDVAFIGPYTFEPFANTSTVLLPFRTHQVTFQMLSSTAAQNQATLFGINLENGKPGVVYHAIGVNGAKFKHYLAAELFVDQTAALAPDLLILSLGTNEALDYPYFDPQFANQMDSLIQRLRAKNPNAKILLTTPSDSYRRKTRRNPGVEFIRNKIKNYADLHNLAYWDLYQAGGGKHSADLWKKSRLMRYDGIHFTANGYVLQGNLLYEALMKGYNEYVQYRHP
jgi:lysophospholipase L1-like esterase